METETAIVQPANRSQQSAAGSQQAAAVQQIVTRNTQTNDEEAVADLVIALGDGLRIAGDMLNERSGTLNFTPEMQAILWLQINELRYDTNRAGQIRAQLNIPYLDDNEVTLRINREGRVSSSWRLRKRLQIAALNNPRVVLTLNEQNELSTSVEINGAQLTPNRLEKLQVTGGGTITLTGNRWSGSVQSDFVYQGLGSGSALVNFNESGEFSGSGSFDITQPQLAGIHVDIQVAEGNLAANVNIPVDQVVPTVAGLEIPEGEISLSYLNGRLSGNLQNLLFRYRDLAEGRLSAEFVGDRLQGDGELSLLIGELTEVNGTFGYRRGSFHGSLRIDQNDFPEGLPIESSRITIAINEEGVASFGGEARINIQQVGQGTIAGSYEEGQLDLGATVALDLPGLQSTEVLITYIDGHLEGSADISIDSEVLPGIESTLHVEYKDQLWGAEQQVEFSIDEGRAAGQITIGIQQSEDEDLIFFGSGDVTVRIAENLEGILGLVLNPDATVDLSGEIRVPEPVELFPEYRQERELLNLSKNIPLWAILVAVIRLRAGVRAGVGPGVLRNISISGEYTIGEDADPTFDITGELYIPAFAEAYIAFGAGLGLDVVLGSLTGGIEGVATAGIYGAISVVPLLSYDGTDYSINGTATLAAGAKFKLGLNAWAEVEAFWVTVWEREWALGEWIWDIGPNLAVQAEMNYVFGHPEPPSLEFRTDNIDAEALIQDAMPKDGPAPSGAREALGNRAEWSGPTGGQAPAPEPPAPPQEANSAARPPESAPPRPPRRASRPPATPPNATPANQNQSSTTANNTNTNSLNQPSDTAANHRRAETVTADELPNTDQPRHPSTISLNVLNLQQVTVPRTREQQGEDLRVAKRLVQLASRAAQNTDELDDYFAKIKNYCQLNNIGFKRVGRSVVVRLEINPIEDVRIEEPLVGEGVPGLPGLHTHVDFSSGGLSGSRVGVVMESTQLGPDHPEGRPPSSSALSGIMDRLVTDRHLRNPSKYIKGHLLNDNLGGPGTALNLFPITAEANRSHNRQIEETVKNWVNTEKYWVYYKVEVEEVAEVLTGSGKSPQNKVDSNFKCEAYILSTNGDKINRRVVNIRSRYAAAPSANHNSDSSFEVQESDNSSVDERNLIDYNASTQSRAEYNGEVRLSSRHRNSRSAPKATSLDTNIYNLINTIRTGLTTSLKNELTARLTGLRMGPRRIDTLVNIFNGYGRGANISDADQAVHGSNLTYINNRASDIVSRLS